MLIVPLVGDKLTLAGFERSVEVSSYSALTKGGVVYLKNPPVPELLSVSLALITAVNGVLVEQDSAGMFVPKGLVRRKINLPQPGDVVKLVISTSPQGIKDVQGYEVEEVRLSSKPAAPLQLKLVNGGLISLADIVDVTKRLGFEKFNLPVFRVLYSDYFPVGFKI